MHREWFSVVYTVEGKKTKRERGCFCVAILAVEM